jgi:hypothetical protein
MRGSRSILWRQVIAGSLIALGLAWALANIGKPQMAKTDETPPADWREQNACLPADDIVSQTWRAPNIAAVSQ